MYTTNMNMQMSANDAKAYMDSQEKLGQKMINAFKKYWNENSEMIVAGLASMNGNVYIPNTRR